MYNLVNYCREIIEEILDNKITTKEELQNYKIKISKKYNLPGVPKNSEILAEVTEQERPIVEAILIRKPVRTISGVAAVAVMTSPAPCPHGKCIYCPGGVENNSPQSYTGKEPAARRGEFYHFDPFDQVVGRMEQLEVIGHSTEKIDLIIMGGTFTSRPQDYQDWFIKRCFDAMNGFDSTTLEEAQNANETAAHRCIGLTIETRPDAMAKSNIDNAMRLGMTRVEMGVQILDDSILRAVNRGHGLQEVIDATAEAKRSGLKVCYHVMPGLPGSSPEQDIACFRKMFDDPHFRPDMLKIYPTLVVKGTKLYEMWENGEYAPYATEEAVEVIAKMKAYVPPWVRIQRIQRDIPVPLIEAGVMKGHLRELVKAEMKRNGTSCNCIRCHEVGHMGVTEDQYQNLELTTTSYEASGGMEHFIAFRLPDVDALAGYVRLRTGDGEIASIRELKVFGQLAPIGSSGKWQHRGAGKELMHEAEEKARSCGCSATRVTSGVGVRKYYESLGYTRSAMYMVKKLR
ncbi:tRNA uridine(34) 5-carboxymethylaminomethyl modification radical SAM/GNAT enzyme Elp3 [Candidatus Methanomassiliicoccus intestinalis]|uniref:tRNA uridine(34) 5-carboxymethylaminomethyl modification radical SAM/GNAT enzyme Elp3 n=1 Tax=Candidatus Methanomassiliicoccus intestinalis TaxID=1406512 RepID=UPI0037DD28AD